MKVLIIGSGGREHALATAYAKNERVKKVLVAPGNGLMDFFSKKIFIFPYIRVNDFQSIADLVKKEAVDLVDVATDEQLAQGYVDKFRKLGIKTFGPTQKQAEIEWSKDWARSFMNKYNLPSPQFKSFNNQKEAYEYIEKLEEQTLYIKASGLASGKGAIRAETKAEAKKAIDGMTQFGKAGETFLIEQAMIGEEFSLFALCDGENYRIINAAQDHKTVFEKDMGPNTGGMGCVARAGVITNKIIHEAERDILKPFMKGMRIEGRPYSGILYVGGMLTENGIKLVEFNARWGDPEAEVILPGITKDYITIIETVLDKKLKQIKISPSKKVRISIAACASGYPDNYDEVKGKEIFGINEVSRLKNVKIFGAGIKRNGKRFFVNGGRIFHIVAKGKNIIEARRRAYRAMSFIHIEGNNLHYRIDIGWRDVSRFYN
ncbi:MAG: phosphoribosylamine--glycine ligase [Candidatus Levyibacteriota bacterium]|nr:MAG: phosphoribosylamine--glycine ligase [Candidatus Levybacteria bacterium]